MDEFQIKGGQVFVNGQQLIEPYVNPEPWTVNANYPTAGASGPIKVPDGEYFVMGDNRNKSSDSRVFGFVRRDQIEARAWFRVIPLDRFGPVDNAKGHFASRVGWNAGDLARAYL